MRGHNDDHPVLKIKCSQTSPVGPNSPSYIALVHPRGEAAHGAEGNDYVNIHQLNKLNYPHPHNTAQTSTAPV